MGDKSQELPVHPNVPADGPSLSPLRGANGTPESVTRDPKLDEVSVLGNKPELTPAEREAVENLLSLVEQREVDEASGHFFEQLGYFFERLSLMNQEASMIPDGIPAEATAASLSAASETPQKLPEMSVDSNCKTVERELLVKFMQTGKSFLDFSDALIGRASQLLVVDHNSGNEETHSEHEKTEIEATHDDGDDGKEGQRSTKKGNGKGKAQEASKEEGGDVEGAPVTSEEIDSWLKQAEQNRKTTANQTMSELFDPADDKAQQVVLQFDNFDGMTPEEIQGLIDDRLAAGYVRISSSHGAAGPSVAAPNRACRRAADRAKRKLLAKLAKGGVEEASVQGTIPQTSISAASGQTLSPEQMAETILGLPDQQAPGWYEQATVALSLLNDTHTYWTKEQTETFEKTLEDAGSSMKLLIAAFALKQYDQQTSG